MNDSVKCLGFNELLKTAQTTGDISDNLRFEVRHIHNSYVHEELMRKLVDARRPKWVSVDVLKGFCFAKERSLRKLEQKAKAFKDIVNEEAAKLPHSWVNVQTKNMNKKWISLEDVKQVFDETFSSSDSLSPEEIRDLEASEKEIASGTCKVFENAEDLIADLHKKEKGSLQEKKESV